MLFQSLDCTYVLVVGEKNYVNHKDFSNCLKMLYDISKKFRIIVFSLPYDGMEYYSCGYNNFIHKFNCDLYNIASLRDNFHVIDINKNNDFIKRNVKIANNYQHTQLLCKMLLWNIDKPTGMNKTVIEIVTHPDIQIKNHNLELDSLVKPLTSITEKNGKVEQSLPSKPSDFLDQTQWNIAFR